MDSMEMMYLNRISSALEDIVEELRIMNKNTVALSKQDNNQHVQTLEKLQMIVNELSD